MRALSEIAPNLELDSSGLWIAPSVSSVSYPESGNDLYFAVEDESFWFRHRNRCILEAVRLLPPSGAIFDIGGGNGFVARSLQDDGRDVVLVEPGPRGASNARRRGIRQVVRASFDDAGFLPDSLPAAGLFDVIEHVEGEQAFLAALVRALSPGGRLYLTVHAGRWLWSREDISAGHYRRYTLASLKTALARAGLEVEYATCFFRFLPIPLFLRRVIPYRLGLAAKNPGERQVRADHMPGGLTARILDSMAASELRRIQHRRVSGTGTSCLAVARKVG